MSGRQWRRLAGLLSATNRVVVPDLLGSGENPPWPDGKPFECSLDVDALRELLDSLGAPAHLVGHSYGGFLALALAREHPTSLRSVAVYDPVAFGVLHASRDGIGLDDLERVRSAPGFLDDELGGSAPWFEAFVDYWNGPGSWRSLSADARASFLRVGRKVYLEARSLLADRTPLSEHARIAAPTLLLGGERSPLAARRVVALLAQALPRARAHELAGAGHLGPITHAAEVHRLIAEHVAAADARS